MPSSVTIAPATIAPAAVMALVVASPVTHVRGDLAQEDQRIRAAIEDRLWLDPLVHANGIDVSVENGVVSLDGAVHHLAAKKRSSRLAELVRGVRLVINDLLVRPAGSPSEAVLRDELVAALREDPATEAYELVVDVEDGGKVVLTGAVGSWGERELAGMVVANVRGVTAVENRVQLPAVQRPEDQELQADIEGLLRWNVYIDDDLVEVEVTDGVAHLSGLVASAAEKTRAGIYAFRAGAETVQNDLEVVHWARDKVFRGAKYESVADDSVEGALERALRLDPRVATASVEVSVSNGVATLSGVVGSLRGRRAAYQTAMETVGVERVRNHLKVRPKSRDDVQLASAVGTALRRDPIVDRFDLQVFARGGVVFLDGTVDSHLERARAEEVAGGVWGAVDVVNLIAVKLNSSFGLEPSMSLTELNTLEMYEGLEPRTAHFRDEVVQANIEDLLDWSVYVNADRLEVSVDGGTATVRGAVGSLAEQAVAGRIALAGGAAEVRNLLEVTPSAIEGHYVR